jgi:Cytochrome c
LPIIDGLRKALLVSALVVIVLGLNTRAEGPKSVLDAPLARTPQRLARGQYIVEGLSHCFRCHSEYDSARADGHVPEGKRGGGRVFNEEESGLRAPWRLVAPNITPDRETGAGTWSDADFVRALRQGIGHDGRVLDPGMPYWNFRNMTDEDLASTIVYVRSLPPIRHVLPKRSLPADPKPLTVERLKTPAAPAGASEQVRRGEYLAHLGNCAGCHDTQTSDRQPVAGMEFGGGRVLRRTWGAGGAANITPDASGIGYYDEAKFMQVIRSGHVGARKLSPIMIWADMKNLTDGDLKALFAYLRTVPPVQHKVDNTEEATLCPKCRNRHGFGERN